MAIRYVAPARSRERICLFGMEGTGKTSAAAQIALLTNAPNIWIVETDNTWDEFLESPNYSSLEVREEWVSEDKEKLVLDTSFYKAEGGRIVLFRPRNWDEYCWGLNQAFGRAKTEGTRDDWIVIDNQSNLWEQVQSWYTVKAYGKTPAELALEIRQRQIKTNKKNHTVMEEQFTDWGAINPQYVENVRKNLLNPPCHILGLAMQKQLDKDEKDKDARATWGPYGVKPAGQKATGQDARTVLLLTKDQRFDQQTYLMTACKDRERESVNSMEWSNFVKDYLVKVGGWKPIVVKEGE